MKIEFGQLKLGNKSKNNLIHCVDTNWASAGPKVKEFEQKWTDLFKYDASAAVSSGTDAVLNAVAGMYTMVDAKRGDEVIVPALSFIATSNAVLMAGFTPKFVDINRETLNIDPSKIEEAITDKTVGIVAVHTMGKPCEMDKIMDIAFKHDLYVIEDCAEAHGASYKNKYIGQWGDAGTFSFYVAHLICCGEGGMVSSKSVRWDARDIISCVRSTRSHGREDGSLYFDHVRFGFNSKMNDLEASLGLEGIDSFWETFNTRHNSLMYLMDSFNDLGLDKYIWYNTQDEEETVCPHGFSMTLKDPKYDITRFSSYLENASIHVKRNFGCIPTQHRSFEWMGIKPGIFKEAEYVGTHGIHIGCHQYLTRDNLNYIIDKVNRYFTNVI